MTARLEIAGQRFGSLTAIKFLVAENRASYWLFKCDCGVFVKRIARFVRYAASEGTQVSCGCKVSAIRAENGRRNTTHGLSKYKLYDVHRQMMRRCYDPDCKDYPAYGERGISVCEDWQNMRTFMDWCESSGYCDGLTIERIDVNGGYEPANCTWIPNEFQAHNTRRLHNLTVNGETKFISQWARDLGIGRNTIHTRLEHGWSPEEALTTPVGAKRRSAA